MPIKVFLPLVLSVLMGAILLLPSPILAQDATNTTSAQGTTCHPGNNSPDPNPDPNSGGVWTAIGCIPTDPQALVAGILRYGLGAAGGISLLLMAFGAIEIITSGGNHEELKKGQGRFTSAILGLVFIIFSVFLLKIIGVDILQIPGFSP